MTNSIEKAMNLTPTRYIPDENRQDFIVDNTATNELVNTAKYHVVSARDMALQAVQDVMIIAQQTQDLKAYSALNDLLKTYAAVSESPVELELKKARLTKGKDGKAPIEEEGQSKVTNQNVFVGSTSDFLDLMKAQIENKSS